MSVPADTDRQPDPSVVTHLTELIQRLDVRAALAELNPDELDKTFGGVGAGVESESESGVSRLAVCPELYHGAAEDGPLHNNGFVMEQCRVRKEVFTDQCKLRGANSAW